MKRFFNRMVCFLKKKDVDLEGKSKKRVLILANNDIGLYNFRKELISELLLNKYDVFISLPFGERVEDLKKLGCNFIETSIDRRGKNPFTDLILLWRYFKILKTLRPDIVLTYTIKPNIYGGVLCRILKVQYIVNITGIGTVFQAESSLKKIVTLVYRISLKKAQFVLFENHANLEIFSQNGLVRKSQAIKVNGAGVNLAEFSYSPMEFEKELRFIYLGRVMKEKGVDELFEAATRIKREFKNIAFDILGFFEEDYKEKMDSFIKEGVIHFYGYQKDVKGYIQKAHCLVLPSYHEGMSNTLLEGASMGRPLITSDIPGCREAVIDGETGFLSKVGSSESLYEKMREYILLTKEKKQFMGKRSREHIEHCFDRKGVVEKTVELIASSCE